MTDVRRARDGLFLEALGFFNPLARGKEESCRLNMERIAYWRGVGAQMTARVQQLVKARSDLQAAA